MKKIFTLSLLRVLALIATLIGSGISLGLVLQAGHNNKSVLLIGLFVSWVLSPFIALMVANVVSKLWSVFTRLTLYSLMVIITLASLVGYWGGLSSPGMKPAFIFLIIPLISWLLIVIVIPIAALVSRRLSRKSDSV